MLVPTFKFRFSSVLTPSVLTLVAVLSMGAWAQIDLDVIVRDFPLGYEGFEEFDVWKGDDGECAEKGDRESRTDPVNGVCVSGDRYVSCDQDGSEELKYGQDNCDNLVGKRGYTNGPDATIGSACWANPVYVTRGMVERELDYSGCTEAEMSDIQQKAYCAKPKPANGLCYGGKLQEWFSDGGQAKRINDVITLNPSGSSYYEIDYNYNSRTNWGEGEDNGYFPLDKYADEEGMTWGKQSLNIWCPYSSWSSNKGETITGEDNGHGYFSYEPDELTKNLCFPWWKNGGPQKDGAAQKTVDALPQYKYKLHNYGFTMAGVAMFKYQKGDKESFEFIGDDDMWIFIDGQLVVDLGGTHTAAPAKIYLDEIAAERGGDEGGWADQTTHVINFYYADRQTDGSNMKLRMSLSGYVPGIFGAPQIKKAETQAESGNYKTLLYVSTKLDTAYFQSFIKSGNYPILVKRANKSQGYCNYRLDEAHESAQKGGVSGQIYIIKGKVLCGDKQYDLASGDSLVFNVPTTNEGTPPGFPENSNATPLPKDVSAVKSTAGKAPTTIDVGKNWWAPNTNKLAPPEFVVNPPDEDPKKPPFPGPDDAWGGGGGSANDGSGLPTASGGSFTPNPSGTLTVTPGQANGASLLPGKGVVHSFGNEGENLPVDRTGELIITAYPNAPDPGNEDWMAEYNRTIKGDKENPSYFGIPPEAKDDQWFGLVDPTVQADKGGYQFVKNGFVTESNMDGTFTLSPTRCTSTIAGNKASINCLNFNVAAAQPFQLNVMVYDHLGNFVTQYRETVGDSAFRYAVQGPSFVAENKSYLESLGVADAGTCNESNAATCCEMPSKDNYGKKNTATTNGYVNVGVNIYPFGINGRIMGTGVYILKIDRIDMPYEGCFSSGSSADMGTYGFTRYHSDAKFGYMRTKKK